MQAHDIVLTSMRRYDVASTSFRRHVPTRFLINQCQIITFLILKSDVIQISRIELNGIVLPVPSNQIKVTFIIILPFNLGHLWFFSVSHRNWRKIWVDYWGGAKGYVAPPLSNYWGGAAPPPPPRLLGAATLPFLFLLTFTRSSSLKGKNWLFLLEQILSFKTRPQFRRKSLVQERKL